MWYDAPLAVWRRTLNDSCQNEDISLNLAQAHPTLALISSSTLPPVPKVLQNNYRCKVKYKYLIPRNTANTPPVLRSNLMWLYFPVDLNGNLIMIEKLVLGEIWTRDLPIFNPDALTSVPSWHVK